MFEKYELYLFALDQKLSKFFENQKEYICCKEGCAHCCCDGNYPYTSIEAEYLKFGLARLPLKIQNDIQQKILKIKKDKLEWKKDEADFIYECPFLINNRCSIYSYRGIICRTFGLAYFDKNNKTKVPNCVFKGLNYAKVYDPKTKLISTGLFEKEGYKNEPIAFNLSLNFLYKNEVTEYIGIEFGKVKPMVDWL